MTKQTAQAIRNTSGSAEPRNIHPEQEQIEALAYQLWVDRGRPIGSAEEDWYRAEQELRNRTVMVQRAA